MKTPSFHKKCAICLFLLFLLYYPCSASHVVGGNLEMVAVKGKMFEYKFALNLYFDEINQDVGGAPDADARIYVYKKADNKRVDGFYVSYVKKQAVVYTNQLCATRRQIKTTLYRYEKIIILDPLVYNDPDGYYITWQYCCRNGDIDNIKNPGTSGQTFYLEFPALTQNGRVVINSSPIFDLVDGEFICVNEPFQFAFDARDDDGDELRYSIVTPYDRFDSNIGTNVNSGLTVAWLPGYSPNQSIPGNPPLSISKTTGELTVTASRTGLFVFSVEVEEFRNGKKIGLVRRDYQLFVIDCPPQTPPDPTILVDGQNTGLIEFCQGKKAELKAATNPNWEYQWKKDGKNVIGATGPTLLVGETGNYQLVTSLKAQCSRSRRSRDVQVNVLTSQFKLKRGAQPYICGPTGSVKIEAPTSDGQVTEWFYNGIKTAEAVNTINAQKPGKYWSVTHDYIQGCSSRSDTLTILYAPLPVVSFAQQSSAITICSGDSAVLSATQQPNYAYRWYLNTVPIDGITTARIKAAKAGSYVVEVTDTTGCQSTVALLVAVSDRVTVTLDSVLTFCSLDDAKPVQLVGQPAGGIYAGPGVNGSTFDPKKAGVGRHELTYSIHTGLLCQQGTAQRRVAVSNVSVLIKPERDITEMCADDSLLLSSVPLSGLAQYRYNWLVDDRPLSTTSQYIARKTGHYTLQITDAAGCRSESRPFALTVVPSISVSLDSIPDYCGYDHAPVMLRGYPAGGIFTGTGVHEGVFNPNEAGLGTHTVTYEVKSPFACQNGRAIRSTTIRQVQAIDLGADREINRGTSVRLTGARNSDYHYKWTPITGLDDPTAPTPEASPDNTISYRVVVSDDHGCQAQDSVRIIVHEPIWIPDSFSPNGDGINDKWELKGINNYPEAEVTVFNRWGEAIFYSRGYGEAFDGQYQGNTLPVGVYTYQIRPSLTREPLLGTIAILH